jgi:transcriptional regulator of arginine metabolism
MHAARALMADLVADGREAAMTTKVQRQQLIARLIAKTPVSSQPQLLDLLSGEGISATQATVSRDLEDLGAVKVRVPRRRHGLRDPRVRAGPPRTGGPPARVMGEWVAEVKPSANLVVLRTPPGCAHVVASALDRSTVAGLLGTVAGDDTLMCVADEAVGGRALAETLRDLAGLT